MTENWSLHCCNSLLINRPYIRTSLSLMHYLLMSFSKGKMDSGLGRNDHSKGCNSSTCSVFQCELQWLHFYFVVKVCVGVMWRHARMCSGELCESALRPSLWISYPTRWSLLFILGFLYGSYFTIQATKKYSITIFVDLCHRSCWIAFWGPHLF